MKAILAGFILLGCVSGYSQKSLTIHFGFNKYGITEVARKQLDSFLLAEKANLSQYVFNLDGYCDFTGTDEYNNKLSETRVSAVKKYLLSRGIMAASISNAKGHGENDPLNENKTEEERQLNRRVQVRMVQARQSKEDVSLTEKIADTATKAGTHIVLKNINFFGGSPFLLPESFPTVDELLETMRRNPKLVIEIQGHICCIATSGDSPYGGTGNGLSEERAKMIYAELVGKGIAADRVSYKGFGHSMPIYPFPEKTEEERVANRRVEIKIISK